MSGVAYFIGCSSAFLMGYFGAMALDRWALRRAARKGKGK